MKPHTNTTINKILNALTFGMLNRISDLEHNQNMGIIETSAGFNKLDRVDTDVSALSKEVIVLRDELVSLRQSQKPIVLSEADHARIANIVKEETEHYMELNLDRKIRLHGLVRQNDLPDFDEFVKYEAHGDEVLTVDNMKETFGEEIQKEYFEDIVRTIVKNLCDDEYTTEDKVREICRDEFCDSDIPNEDRVREIIESELNEKNFATTSEAESISEDAIEAHEAEHHSDDADEDDAAPVQEEGGDRLNELMKPIVLSGKMVEVDISKDTEDDIVLTKEERDLIMVIRAVKATEDESDADTMQEAISQIGDDDERKDMLTALLKASAEYAYGMGLWHEDMAHSFRKEGRQSEALYDSTIAHGYDEAGQAIKSVHNLLERAEQHAQFVSDRIEDK
jgi:hypothetical protein